MANGATVFNAQGAVFTEFRFTLITVGDRVSIRVIDTSHSRYLGSKLEKGSVIAFKSKNYLESKTLSSGPHQFA
jgi:hypothetical protein